MHIVSKEAVAAGIGLTGLIEGGHRRDAALATLFRQCVVRWGGASVSELSLYAQQIFRDLDLTPLPPGLTSDIVRRVTETGDLTELTTVNNETKYISTGFATVRVGDRWFEVGCTDAVLQRPNNICANPDQEDPTNRYRALVRWHSERQPLGEISLNAWNPIQCPTWSSQHSPFFLMGEEAHQGHLQKLWREATAGGNDWRPILDLEVIRDLKGRTFKIPNGSGHYVVKIPGEHFQEGVNNQVSYVIIHVSEDHREVLVRGIRDKNLADWCDHASKTQQDQPPMITVEGEDVTLGAFTPRSAWVVLSYLSRAYTRVTGAPVFTFDTPAVAQAVGKLVANSTGLKLEQTI